MEECCILRGSAQPGNKGHLVAGKRKHGRLLLRKHAGKLVVQEINAPLIEGNGAVGGHTLVHKERPGGPLPAIGGATLERYLLGESLHALLLLEREDVGRRKVLVHKEAVAQVLEGGDGRERKVRQAPLQSQTGVEHAATVSAGAVLCNDAALRRTISQEIGASILVALFIRGCQVGTEYVCWFPCQFYSAASRFSAVGMFAGGLVVEETVFAIVVSAKRQSKFF